MLGAYWPMSERLALTTRDMLSAHSRLYDVQEQEYNYEATRMNRPMQSQQQQQQQHQVMQLPQQQQPLPQPQPQPQPQSQPQTQHQLSSPDIDSLAPISTVETSNIPQTSSSMPYSSFVPNNNLMPIQPQQHPLPLPPPSSSAQQQQQQQQQVGGYQVQGSMNNNDIYFNSCEFLYDSALFGQIIFDTSKSGEMNMTPQYSMPMSNPPIYTPYQHQQPKQTTTPWGV